jgi:ArsR family transcriptional regulator
MEFDEEVFEMHAQFCSLFSNVTRMKILWLLNQRGECKAGELAEEIGVSAQNVSQHLRLMRDRGAVATRKKGREVYYKVANANFTKGARLIRKGVMEELKKKQGVL